MGYYDVEPNGTHLQPDGYNPASDNYPFGYPKEEVKEDYYTRREREKKAQRQRAAWAAENEAAKARAENEREIEALERSIKESKERKSNAYEAYKRKYENASIFYRITHKNPNKGMGSFSTVELEKKSGIRRK